MEGREGKRGKGGTGSLVHPLFRFFRRLCRRMNATMLSQSSIPVADERALDLNIKTKLSATCPSIFYYSAKRIVPLGLRELNAAHQWKWDTVTARTAEYRTNNETKTQQRAILLRYYWDVGECEFYVLPVACATIMIYWLRDNPTPRHSPSCLDHKKTSLKCRAVSLYHGENSTMWWFRNATPNRTDPTPEDHQTGRRHRQEVYVSSGVTRIGVTRGGN